MHFRTSGNSATCVRCSAFVVHDTLGQNDFPEAEFFTSTARDAHHQHFFRLELRQQDAGDGACVDVARVTVVIIDPVCDTNNVASRITEDERKEIVQLADESWATAHFASVEDDFEIWKELFGKGFKVEDAA